MRRPPQEGDAQKLVELKLPAHLLHLHEPLKALFRDAIALLNSPALEGKSQEEIDAALEPFMAAISRLPFHVKPPR